jgi:hypothetical protein
MYKKIVHHITEEHFHHPHAMEMAAELHSNRKIPAPQGSASTAPSGAVAMGGDRLSTFTASELMAWSNLVYLLRHWVVSAVSGHDDLVAAKTAIQDQVESLKKLLSAYYNSATVDAFGSALNQMLDAVTNEISSVKTNARTPLLINATNNAINAWASTLGSVNPTSWPSNVVAEIWTRARDNLIGQTEARLKKDYVSDSGLVKDLHNILVAGRQGQPLGFASVLIDGVIKAFPQQFGA